VKGVIVDDDERLVGSVEAARITGMSEQSIRRLCKAGTIDCQKIGHDWIIRRGALHGLASKRPGSGRKPSVPKEQP
jgi:hypothetical protein